MLLRGKVGEGGGGTAINGLDTCRYVPLHRVCLF